MIVARQLGDSGVPYFIVRLVACSGDTTTTFPQEEEKYADSSTDAVPELVGSRSMRVDRVASRDRFLAFSRALFGPSPILERPINRPSIEKSTSQDARA
jgi:hypothetical protein